MQYSTCAECGAHLDPGEKCDCQKEHGDFICDLHGMGPEETVFVLEDWMRTEHYLQCKNEGRNT